MKDYKVEFEDGEFEIITTTEEKAFEEACEYEEEHGTVFNIFEIDENYEEVKTIF